MALRFGFSFAHHGRYSSFHRMIAFLDKDDVAYDATPSMIRKLPGFAAKRMEWRYLRWSEKRAWARARKHDQQVVHYLYPENTFFRGKYFKDAEKIIISCHQPLSYVEKHIRSPVLSMLRNALEVADGVAVLGVDELDLYKELAPKATVRFIPHGVDADWFHPMRDEGAGQSDTPTVLTVGNWLRDYEFWADVVNYCAQKRHKIHFKVLANRMNIDTAMSRLTDDALRMVTPLCGVSDEDLRKLYWDSTILFLPLTGAMANNAILEAMATGLPIVTTDLPATRAYTKEYADFFPGDDASSAAQVIYDLLQDQDAMETRSSNLRAEVDKSLSWPSVVAQYRRFQDELFA